VITLNAPLIACPSFAVPNRDRLFLYVTIMHDPARSCQRDDEGTVKNHPSS
jgi:hypothetical protein